MSTIHFGTDGWRAVIGDQFTFQNIRKVAVAAARHFKTQERNNMSAKNSSLFLIGYDNRFFSEEFAREVERVFSAEGFKTMLSDSSVPTPALSLAVVKKNALGGIMITASHNPAKFNGLKIKMQYGASAGVSDTKQIESYVNGMSDHQIFEKTQKLKKSSNCNTTSFLPLYNKSVKHHVDMDKINAVKRSIIIDPMYGSGAHVLEDILGDSKMSIMSIRSIRDPLFGGVNPEPILANLKELKSAVQNNKNSIGIAFDGDADRIGLVDEKGEFVNSHQIFSLLLIHLVENRKKQGRVIKTISGSFMINRLAKMYGLDVLETPIGFKHITEQMLYGDVLIGGEESGGIGFAGHIPERDAILSALYILEMMAFTGKSLKELTSNLSKRVGLSYYDRMDVHLNEIIDKEKFRILAKKQSAKIFSKKPKEIKDYDGIKFIWADDSWLLLRMSGTEPVLRIYAESDSKTKTQKMLALGKQFRYNQ